MDDRERVRNWDSNLVPFFKGWKVLNVSNHSLLSWVSIRHSSILRYPAELMLNFQDVVSYGPVHLQNVEPRYERADMEID